METEGRYTLVGTLVLAVAALMTLAILWLAGAAETIAYQTYTIYFKQQSLDGLAVGSPVKCAASRWAWSMATASPTRRKKLSR